MNDGGKRLSGSVYKEASKLKFEEGRQFIFRAAKSTTFFHNPRPSAFNLLSETESKSKQILNEPSNKN